MLDSQKSLKSTFDSLFKKLNAAQTQVKAWENAIHALREVCEHDWYYDGHSHNDSIYVCSICRKEEWR